MAEKRNIVDRLRNDVCLTSPLGWQEHVALAREAADEIERLRGILVEANNRWRHEFDAAVGEATDTLFKRLSAYQTDPARLRVADSLPSERGRD